MDEAKIPHFKMIKNVITRMNSNSLLLKGWSVTIFVGLFTLANIKDMEEFSANNKYKGIGNGSL
ncbi:hypothetical protein ACFOUV_13235 [Oceanobacillus longus]|uniref:Uncharacterized protein n=1 Tax=Oceanobacillus longus TaxID=930120 RepID=A0ABV8H1M2_9BACI